MPLPLPRRSTESNIAQKPKGDLLQSLPLEVVDAVVWEWLTVLLIVDALTKTPPVQDVPAAQDVTQQHCKVVTTGDTLTGDKLATYWKLVNTTYPQGGLASRAASVKLAKLGVDVSKATIDRHRSKTCICHRKG